MARILAAGCLAGALLCWGCAEAPPPDQPGPGEVPGLRTALDELGLLLINHSGEFGRGPSKPADLARYAEGGPLAYEGVRAGKIEVVWGATMPGEGEANKPTGVIAYEKKAPTEGGLVLLQNGEVKQLSAEQFNSAPKAK